MERRIAEANAKNLFLNDDSKSTDSLLVVPSANVTVRGKKGPPAKKSDLEKVNDSDDGYKEEPD
jgi:hypothetical protein